MNHEDDEEDLIRMVIPTNDIAISPFFLLYMFSQRSHKEQIQRGIWTALNIF